ncbi:unnamed protein product [Withania somnifera]
MGDQIARGEELVKKAEKKLSGWGLFGSKYDDAADFFDKAANSFKLAKSWDQAGAVYVKLASCHLKLDSKHEAAGAYANAAHCYKKTNTREAISCLEQAVHMFLDIGRLNMSARYYKEIAELYEQEQNLEQAINYYEKAADLFQSEDVTTSANQCKQKIAEFSARVEKYQRAIEIFEEIARHSISNNLLKYGVRGHLRMLVYANFVEVMLLRLTTHWSDELDPTFSGTRECKLLVDLAASIDEEDVAKFTGCLKEYDSMTKLDEWRTTLLLKVKEALKAKELEEDDLT